MGKKNPNENQVPTSLASSRRGCAVQCRHGNAVRLFLAIDRPFRGAACALQCGTG